jgi:hypothetical protein
LRHMSADSEYDAADCEDFQRRLPTLFETGDDLYKDSHLRNCEHCRMLVVDLEYIAEEARRLFGRER